MLTALCLISSPPLSGILVLYIMLTLFVIPPLLIASRRYLPLAFAASAMIWAGAQAFPAALAPLTHRWYLNPFAWQLLFTLGAISASLAERRLLPPRSRLLLGLAVGYLLFALLVAARRPIARAPLRSRRTAPGRSVGRSKTPRFSGYGRSTAGCTCG